MANVNLDALIPREDFEIKSEGEMSTKISVPINELEINAFFYRALRKPDFQRETNEWDPKTVAGLIRTFINGELIPAVILWDNKGLLFVIDGSHRLGALIAWVQDDYGDGTKSQEFFGHQIPDEQIKIAQKTRKMVEDEFGSYQDHLNAMGNPGAYGPDILKRALRFASLTLTLQWVKGDAAKAEGSFARINQRAAIITPEELSLIKTRKQPSTIAARAIIRRGTGYEYWSDFKDPQKRQVVEVATDVHRLLFEPTIQYPLKTQELPVGGPVHAATALGMVYSLVSLSIGAPSQDEDREGTRTIEVLSRCRRVMQLLVSTARWSLGLHPAVYFYSWTGKQQPILFLVIAEMMVDRERQQRLPEFIKTRGAFESFLVANRVIVQQVIRKFGTKDSGKKQVRAFYEAALAHLSRGGSQDTVVDALRTEASFSYLQPGETFGGKAGARFSAPVRSGVVLQELLGHAPRCPICNGYVPRQAITVDHIERREDGGTSAADNAQVVHPYCNTGYKESQTHAGKSRADR
jgi:hypothetical protein